MWFTNFYSRTKPIASIKTCGQNTRGKAVFEMIYGKGRECGRESEIQIILVSLDNISPFSYKCSVEIQQMVVSTPKGRQRQVDG